MEMTRIRRWPRPGVSGFNGATAFRRWRFDAVAAHRISTAKLQWGHRLSAMEIWVAFTAPGDQAVASMGPPPFGDGDTVRVRGMSGVERELQWGHRLSAMEMHECQAILQNRKMLQWGHRLSAMEIW